MHDDSAVPFCSYLQPNLPLLLGVLLILLVFHLSFPDLRRKFCMGVSSLLPLIKYVCLDPIAHHAFLLSWIRRVNVAVPMTLTSEAPGGFDGIVALTSSSSTSIDRALLYSGRPVCLCVECRHQPDLFRFVCWGLTISLRIKRTDGATSFCGFSHNTIAPTSPSGIHCYYKIYKLFSSYSLTQPHFHISGGMQTLAAWHKSQTTLTIYGDSLIVRSSSLLLFPPTSLSPASFLRANTFPSLYSH
jgi:hypothetical protein